MSAEHDTIGSSRTARFSKPHLLRTLLVSAAILTILVVCFFAVQAPPEPAYRGKTLTAWLQTYAPSSRPGRHSAEWNATDDAVRHIGTNGIPVLLQLLRQKDSPLKLYLVEFAQKCWLIKGSFVSSGERNIEASRAFIALGDTAKDAVPALIEIYEANISVESRCAVEDALAWIGPAAKPAIPMLLQAATNSNARVRAGALWALGDIHDQPELCLPTLIRALGDSDNWARLSSVHALGGFGTNAQSASRPLQELANGLQISGAPFGAQLRLEVMKALRKISPGPDSPISQPNPLNPDFESLWPGFLQ